LTVLNVLAFHAKFNENLIVVVIGLQNGSV